MSGKKISTANGKLHYVTAWRRHFKLSAAELARRSGLTDSFLNQIEKGRSLPSLPTLHQIAKGLDIPAGALISIDPETLPQLDDPQWSSILLTEAISQQMERLTNLMDANRQTMQVIEAKLLKQQVRQIVAKAKSSAA